VSLEKKIQMACMLNKNEDVQHGVCLKL